MMNKYLFVVILFTISNVRCLTFPLIASGKDWTDLNRTEIFNLKISHLDVSCNDIKKIDPDQFKYHKSLQVLILDNNKHFEFQPNIAFLYQNELEKFECENCGINAIYDETFQGLPSLKTILLSHNAIKAIATNSFSKSLLLTTIDLRSNQLKTINPEMFNFPLNLNSINFDNNVELQFENDRYLNNANLKEISLENCNVIEITVKTLKHIPNLTALNLNRNKIVTIEEKSFENNRKLEKLYLENNQLESFSSMLVAPLRQLKTLCIDGNPFIRDSVNVEMQQVYLQRRLRADCGENDESEYFEVSVFPEAKTVIAIDDQFNNWAANEDFMYERKNNFRLLEVLIASYMTIIVIIETISVGLLVYCLMYYLKSAEFNERMME